MVDTLLRFVRRFYGRLTSKNEKGTVVWRDLCTALSPEVGITLRGIVLIGHYQDLQSLQGMDWLMAMYKLTKFIACPLLTKECPLLIKEMEIL